MEFTETELRQIANRWKDPVRQAEDIFNIPDAYGELNPVKIPPPQKEILRSGPLGDRSAMSRVICKGRQIGYSYIEAIEDILLAQKYPNVGQYYVGAKADHGTEFVNKVGTLLKNANHWPDKTPILTWKNIQNMIIHINGGFIKAFTASPSAVRSYTGIKITLDEYAWMISEKNLQKELLTAMRPFIQQGGSVSVLSTVKVTVDEFWNLFSNGDERGWTCFYRPTIENWEDIDLNKPLTEQHCEIPYPWAKIEKLEEARLDDLYDSLRSFKREVLGIPADEKFLLFTHDEIYGNAPRPNHGGLKEVNFLKSEHFVRYTLDLAKVEDVTAGTIVEWIGNEGFERKVWETQADYPEQEYMIAKDVADYDVDELVIDFGGPGQVLIPYLENAGLEDKIIKISNNDTVEVGDYGREKKMSMKEFCFYGLKDALQRKRYHMLNEKPVHAEALRHMSRVAKKESGKTVKISGKEYGRDDHACSKALQFIPRAKSLAFGFLEM